MFFFFSHYTKLWTIISFGSSRGQVPTRTRSPSIRYSATHSSRFSPAIIHLIFFPFGETLMRFFLCVCRPSILSENSDPAALRTSECSHRSLCAAKVQLITWPKCRDVAGVSFRLIRMPTAVCQKFYAFAFFHLRPRPAAIPAASLPSDGVFSVLKSRWKLE